MDLVAGYGRSGGGLKVVFSFSQSDKMPPPAVGWIHPGCWIGTSAQHHWQFAASKAGDHSIIVTISNIGGWLWWVKSHKTRNISIDVTSSPWSLPQDEYGFGRISLDYYYFVPIINSGSQWSPNLRPLHRLPLSWQVIFQPTLNIIHKSSFLDRNVHPSFKMLQH